VIDTTRSDAISIVVRQSKVSSRTDSIVGACVSWQCGRRQDAVVFPDAVVPAESSALAAGWIIEAH
jgi:hypothetical protein